jgi:cell division control protein 6
MSQHFFIREHTIFRDCDVFEFDHIPEQFNYRDAQIRDLAFALEPALRGSRPTNTLLRGLPGTGKTTAVKRIFAEIEETTKRILPVYVNCHNDKTLFAVYSKIYLELFGLVPPSIGTPARQVLHKIAKTLAEQKVVLVVCLDDANVLLLENVLNQAINTILRINNDYPGTRAGIIATTSNMDVDFSRELDSSVISVFQPTEIYFPPYNQDEIRSILQDRIRQAFYPGTIPDEILDDIVDKTMTCGDLRVGLDLVRRAALNAECDGENSVGTKHVESAFEFSKYVHLGATMKTLSSDERKLLQHIAHLSLEDSDSAITSRILFESVQRNMRISYSTFHQRLKKFDEMRLININHKARSMGGQTKEIVLRYDPVKVKEGCGEIH